MEALRLLDELEVLREAELLEELEVLRLLEALLVDALRLGELEVLRLAELVEVLRLLLAGAAVELPRCVVVVSPEGLVVRVVVSCEPDSLTRLFTVD